MKKVFEINEVTKLVPQLKNKTVSLTGGCFDILHSGHINFLKKAKESSDILIVILESDENIKKIKGENRPINSQEIRSNVLSSIIDIDYVINLKGVTKNEEYDKLIVQINPDTIAITEGDRQIEKRRLQCEMIGAKLKVVKKFNSPSTTELIKYL